MENQEITVNRNLQHFAEKVEQAGGILNNLQDIFECLIVENIRLKEEIAQYRGTGGEIAMERSWKMKYKLALKRANDRLEVLGEKPEQIRNREGKVEKEPLELRVQEDGQLQFFTKGDKE